MRDTGLTQAKRLFGAGKFREVLLLLEPQIFRYRTDAEFYTLVGLSCLHTGETGGAATYLGRAHQLDDRNTQILLGIAAVHLKRREPNEAVAAWLKVLDLDTANRTAQRGLDLLRSNPEPLDDRKVAAFVPRPRRDPTRPLIIAVAVAAVLVGASYGALRLVEAVRAGAPAGRPGVAAVSLPGGRPEIIDGLANASIQYTERDLKRAFDRARRYLLDYRDNLAVHELNRILLSNATAAVKQKATLLKGYAEPPDFRTFRDPFSLAEVAAAPEEYADCHVRWSGKVANTVVGEEVISFDLLVGYHEGKILEGVVPVRLAFSAIIEDGGSQEVLGRVVVGEDGEISLEAVSIRPIDGVAP